MPKLYRYMLLFYINIAIGQVDLIPKQPGNQVVCDPGQFGFSDFHGFTIQHQIIANRKLEHHTRISFCNNGNPHGFEAYRPLSIEFHKNYEGPDLVWGKKICTMDIDDNSCYLIARRKQYAIRNLSVYYPDVWIGGMYLCPGENEFEDDEECNNSNAIPLAPLMSNYPWNSWWELPDGRHYVQRIPILQTFDDPSDIRIPPSALPPGHWHDLIDVKEEYEYDEEEVELTRKAERMIKSLFVNPGNSYPMVHYLSKIPYNKRTMSFLHYSEKLYSRAFKTPNATM